MLIDLQRLLHFLNVTRANVHVQCAKRLWCGVTVVAAGQRSAGGDQWRQYSWDDPQPGGGADPQGRPPHPPGAKERERLCARLR